MIHSVKQTDSADAQPSPGLRQRKLLATRSAIETAALRLVHEHGLQAVTIEEIATAADVSSRTFFNHFAGKEAAVLGSTQPLTDVIELLRSSLEPGTARQLLRRVGEIIGDWLTGFAIDSELWELRKDVMLRHPELLRAQLAGFMELETEITSVLAANLQGMASETDARDSAQAIMMITGNAVRYAVIGSMQEQDAPPGDLRSRLRRGYEIQLRLLADQES